MAAGGGVACCVGVCCEASQTVCVVLELANRLVQCTATFPALDMAEGGGREAALQSMAGFVQQTLASAGLGMQQVVSLCLCMTDPPTQESNRSALQASLARWLGNDALPVAVHSDAIAALAAGTSGVLHGCVIIAGTGVVAVGVSDGLSQARASGFGPRFMDGGSALDLGSRALHAISKASDGRGAETALTDAVLRHLGLATIDELISWAYSEPGYTHIASLARVVMDCAVAGDAVSEAIVRHGVGELMRSVKAVATRLGLNSQGSTWRLVFAGGMLMEGSLYSSLLQEATRDACPHAQVVYPQVQAAHAAAWLALAAATVKTEPAPLHAPQAQQAPMLQQGQMVVMPASWLPRGAQAQGLVLQQPVLPAQQLQQQVPHSSWNPQPRT